MPQFLASDFRSLLDAIADSIETTPESKPILTELAKKKRALKEARLTKDQVINILAGFRATAKASEMVNSPPLPDNFANQLVNGLWDVISWMQGLPQEPAPAAAAPAPATAPAPAPAPAARY